jgi:hypothetical protein
MSETSDFLDKIWGRTDGYVAIRFKTREGLFKGTWPHWPSQREQVFDFIELQSAQGSEVYISPPIWKDKPSPGEKWTASQLLGTRVLWVDFDGNAPDTWPVDSGIPEPSIKIQSSTSSRQHNYWVIDEVLTNKEQIENYNRTLALRLGADTSGWDITQLLRPPGTVNFGYAKPERNGQTFPVRIEELSERVYQAIEFGLTEDFRPLVKDRLGDIPTIIEVLAKQTWPDSLYRIFTSPPKDRERSDQMMLAAYEAAEAGFSDEQIYSILLDCDDRWGKYKDRTDREKRLVDFVDRARTKHPL